MSNVLLNGSFESGWYHPDGIPELQIPNDWLFQYADETVENPIDPTPWSKFQRPEVRVLPRGQLPPHEQDLFILDGDHTLKIFKGSGAFLCTLSQNVELQPGRYRLTVKVFADLVKGYEDNGDKIWADDPNGQDGLICFYDVMRADPADWDSLTPGKWNTKTSMFAVVEPFTLDKISINFMCPFPLANSGLFCDAWTLEQIEVEPEPVPERGQPRVQYARTYNVIPANATEEQAVAVFKEGWERGRETTGGSYDDAAIGNLDDRTAVLYGVEAETFLGWYAEHYPGVKLVFRPLPGEEPKSDWQRYLLWQRDPQWRDTRFGFSNCDLTIGEAGCFIANLAMAMRIFGLDANATPVSVDTMLGSCGYSGCRAQWFAITLRLGINIRGGTESDAVDALNRGHLVMAEVLPSDLQHFVLVVEDLGNGGYLMLDPYKNLITQLHGRYEGVESWRILSPVEEPAPPPPPPKPLNELLTLHLQTPVPGWLDYVAAVKPAWVKLVGNFEAGRDVKAASPETKVLIRQHLNDIDTGKCLDDPDKHSSASWFLDKFWDAIVANAPWIDAVEGLNETVPTGNMTRIQQAVDFAVAFADELAARCEDTGITNIVPCLLNTAVGNPQHGYETEKLIPAAEAAIRYGGFLGYHAYFPAHVDHAERWLEEEGRHHHLRALESWKPTFAEHGLDPKYLYTEAGAIGMTVRTDGRPGGYDHKAGWRAALDGDLDRYIRLLIRLSEMVDGALFIFTTGIGIKWSHFLMNEPELKALAAALG